MKRSKVKPKVFFTFTKVQPQIVTLTMSINSLLVILVNFGNIIIDVDVMKFDSTKNRFCKYSFFFLSFFIFKLIKVEKNSILLSAIKRRIIDLFD